MPLQEETPAQGPGPDKNASRRLTRVALWAVTVSILLAGLATFALVACRGMR